MSSCATLRRFINDGRFLLAIDCSGDAVKDCKSQNEVLDIITNLLKDLGQNTEHIAALSKLLYEILASISVVNLVAASQAISDFFLGFVLLRKVPSHSLSASLAVFIQRISTEKEIKKGVFQQTVAPLLKEIISLSLDERESFQVFAADFLAQVIPFVGTPIAKYFDDIQRLACSLMSSTSLDDVELFIPGKLLYRLYFYRTMKKEEAFAEDVQRLVTYLEYVLDILFLRRKRSRPMNSPPFCLIPTEQGSSRRDMVNIQALSILRCLSAIVSGELFIPDDRANITVNFPIQRLLAIVVRILIPDGSKSYHYDSLSGSGTRINLERGIYATAIEVSAMNLAIQLIKRDFLSQIEYYEPFTTLATSVMKKERISGSKLRCLICQFLLEYVRCFKESGYNIAPLLSQFLRDSLDLAHIVDVPYIERKILLFASLDLFSVFYTYYGPLLGNKIRTTLFSSIMHAGSHDFSDDKEAAERIAEAFVKISSISPVPSELTLAYLQMIASPRNKYHPIMVSALDELRHVMPTILFQRSRIGRSMDGYFKDLEEIDRRAKRSFRDMSSQTKELSIVTKEKVRRIESPNDEMEIDSGLYDEEKSSQHEQGIENELKEADFIASPAKSELSPKAQNERENDLQAESQIPFETVTVSYPYEDEIPDIVDIAPPDESI